VKFGLHTLRYVYRFVRSKNSGVFGGCISGTFLFVGAVNNADRLPWHLWTRDRRFFVGCIWGMRVNGGDVEDLPRFADEQQVRGVEPGCKTRALLCAHAQCSHGVCEDRTALPGFVCVCTNTSYSGQQCDEGFILPHAVVATTIRL